MKIDIEHIATLAKLTLPSNEIPQLEKQLEETISIINTLDEIDTTHITATSTSTSLHNVTREDSITPSLSQEEALKNATATHNGFFKVPAIYNS